MVQAIAGIRAHQPGSQQVSSNPTNAPAPRATVIPISTAAAANTVNASMTNPLAAGLATPPATNIVRPQPTQTISQTIAASLDPIDDRHAVPFDFTVREVQQGDRTRKIYTGTVSVHWFQRGFNRLVHQIATERPDLTEKYADSLPKTLPFALSIDGILGPNTNTTKQLLQEYLGFEADTDHFTAEHWSALKEKLAEVPSKAWLPVNFDATELTTPEQQTAANILGMLSHEDPKVLTKLLKTLDSTIPEDATYADLELTNSTVNALVERAASTGLPLDQATLVAVYSYDHTGTGGLTYMRARGVAELVGEIDHVDYAEFDVVIADAVRWIRETEPAKFAQYAALLPEGADASTTFAALVKAVASAESDFFRVPDYDYWDVGLMQISHYVVTEQQRYIASDRPEYAPEVYDLPVNEGHGDPSQLPARIPAEALDPLRNLAAGGSYILEQVLRHHGNLTFAAAAYNAGPYSANLLLPPEDRCVPNVVITLKHGMRIQRRVAFYLARGLELPEDHPENRTPETPEVPEVPEVPIEEPTEPPDEPTDGSEDSDRPDRPGRHGLGGDTQ